MDHDALAEYVAAWVRGTASRMTWTNFRIDAWGTARPDVFSMVKTLDLRKCRPAVHEVKVSRADFQSDVRSEKWRKYLPICQSVIFVTPWEMVKKEEVPKEAGLMWFDPEARNKWDSFQEIKRARPNRTWGFPDEFVMRLLMGWWGTEPSRVLPVFRELTPPVSIALSEVA